MLIHHGAHGNPFGCNLHARAGSEETVSPPRPREVTAGNYHCAIFRSDLQDIETVSCVAAALPPGAAGPNFLAVIPTKSQLAH